MIFDAALNALKRLLTPELRNVFWKTLGLTLLLLIGLWAAVRQVFFTFAWPWMEQILPGMPEWAGWLGIVAAIVAGLGLALVLALMIAPVTALVAGLFLDDVAEVVEREDYPGEPSGQPLPVVRSIVVSLKFLGIVILGNIVALLMLFIPGVNLIAFSSSTPTCSDGSFRIRRHALSPGSRGEGAAVALRRDGVSGWPADCRFHGDPHRQSPDPAFRRNDDGPSSQGHIAARSAAHACGGRGMSAAGTSQVFAGYLQMSAITQLSHSGLRALHT